MPKQEAPDSERYQRRRCCISIDVPMMPCKIFCFIFYASSILLLFFNNPFLVSVGLTSGEAGLITGLSFVAVAIANPCFGALADKTGYRRTILVTLCVGSAVGCFSTPWFARELTTTRLQCAHVKTNYSSNYELAAGPTDFSTSNDSNFNVLRTSEISSTSRFPGGSQIANNSHNILCMSKITPASNSLFYSMLTLSILIHIFHIPIESLSNSIIMNIIEHNPTAQGYGEQRMFGPIGAGIASFLAGLAADHSVYPTLSKYSVIYFVACLLDVLLVPISIVLFKYTRWEREVLPVEDAHNVTQGAEDDVIAVIHVTNEIVEESHHSMCPIMIRIFRNVSNVILMLTALVVGVFFSLMFSFLFLLMEDEMNGSKTAMGFSTLINCISATVMFFFTERTIKLVGGPVICIEVGVLAWIIRLTLISYINNAWLAALPQLLQSLCYALLMAAMVKYVHEVAADEVYITMFSILSTLELSGGGFLANIVGGSMYDAYGGPVLFRGVAFVGLGWLLLLILYFHGVTFIRRLLARIQL